MSNNDRSIAKPSSASAVDAFLRRLDSVAPVSGAGRGRLVFALDATASREATWQDATRIQERMFTETAALGGLDLQLVYYRGLAECRASRWLSDADSLSRAMRKVTCEAGETQSGRVLGHVIAQTRAGRVSALVFVGDSMEEDIAPLLEKAGELRILGVPVFLFHEGGDGRAGDAFARIATMTGGACCHFDQSSPDQLRALLTAVAVFAAGGRKALSDYAARGGDMVRQLTRQITDGR
ncbi:MAG: VWA domain-containing protein [Telmatospirillum sp.]|nr:VWA domain-containing protein [Telmatospirillum sp.]